MEGKWGASARLRTPNATSTKERMKATGAHQFGSIVKMNGTAKNRYAAEPKKIPEKLFSRLRRQMCTSALPPIAIAARAKETKKSPANEKKSDWEK